MPSSSVTGWVIAIGVSVTLCATPSRCDHHDELVAGRPADDRGCLGERVDTGAVDRHDDVAGLADPPAPRARPDRPRAHSVRSASAGITHSLTDWIVVVAVWTPMPDSRIAKSTIANSRFITGPPSMMTMRCQTGSL